MEKKIDELALDVSGKAVAFPAITDKAGYNSAGELARELKRLQADVRASFDPIVDRAHQAHKEAIAQRDKFLKPLTAGEAHVKRLMGDFVAKERALATEKARKEAEAAEDEARIQRDAERAKAIAEAQAIAAAGEFEKAGQAIAEAGKVAEVAQAQAEKMVYEILSAPIATPKTDGVSIRVVTRYEVANLFALVLAVAAGEAPVSFLQPDMTEIRKAKPENVPGIKATQEEVVSVTA